MKPLSPRMVSIAELVVQGYSYKRIAMKLGLKHTSVAEYVHRASQRIGGEGTARARIYRWYYVDRKAA